MGGFQIVQPIAGVGTAAGSPVLTGYLTGTLGLSSGLAAGITAGAGAVLAIGLQLLAAHELRKKQATNENSAVDAAVAGWDQAVAKLVQAYNQGQASADDLRHYLVSPQTGGQGQLWQWYWQEVGPVIQPGRNGCMSGTVPHPPGSFCQGSYGAACCVGYDDLDNSSLYILQALNATEQDGQPHTANVVVVVGSKYGGRTRPAYTVTLQKPSLSQVAVGTTTQAVQTAGSTIAGVGQAVDSLTGAIIGGANQVTQASGQGSFANAIIIAVIAGVIIKAIVS